MKTRLITAGLLSLATFTFAGDKVWTVSSEADWEKAAAASESVELAAGQAVSQSPTSHFSSTVKKFKKKRSAGLVTFKQTTAWDNWREVPNVGMPEMQNAIIFLPVKDGDYWMLAEHSDYRAKRKKGKNGKKGPIVEPDLQGKPFGPGYHAWHSTDMVNWKHCGNVGTLASKWMTTAEHQDGKFFLYYDNPNDQDPHLIVDHDLSDGVPGKDYGMVLDDPSNGSDCAVIRNDDGKFHIIFEDWSYNNAKTHAWDAPLAGHATSPDGIQAYTILDKPAVDERTTPTGKIGTYTHSSSKEPLEYEIHTPEQEAYGDWTAIKVGGQYYLFCDYDPVGGHMSIGRFTSDSLDNQFTWCGEFGDGHPDPSVGFAEGQFYAIQQKGDVDFVSPGPWVGGVEARVGVDTSGNGKIDEWTAWQEVTEVYDYKPGFSRVIDTTPARLDASDLPAGFGFSFEYKTKAITNQSANVVMEQVEVEFD